MAKRKAVLIALLVIILVALLAAFSLTRGDKEAKALSQSVTLLDTADTSFDSQTTSTNYGTAKTLYASPTSWKSYLRFPTEQLPDDATISSVKLRVYGATTSTSKWEVHPAPGTWTESTSYANRPSWVATILATSSVSAKSGVWNEIPLPNSAVTVDAPTSLGLVGTVSGKIGFQSRENLNDPQLVFTYTTPDPAPTTPPTPTESSSPTPSETTTPTESATPTSTPDPTTTAVPDASAPWGVPGNWTLKFDDEFNGTSLDTTKWASNWFGEGGNMNNLGTYSRNVSVADGELSLQLANENGTITGALIHTDYSAGRYQLPVGGYAEARVYFPGAADDSQAIYNWPAWWTSGPSWPSAGEHDIAEGLGGDLTVNYHGTTNDKNYGTVPGDWNNAYHVYGVHRKASSADVYWDGKLVKSYPTGDNGKPEELILNVGRSNSRTPVTGPSGAVKVDYVRAFQPTP